MAHRFASSAACHRPASRFELLSHASCQSMPHRSGLCRLRDAAANPDRKGASCAGRCA
ncbi:MAG: hypothetical protein HSCHL_2449 [Hydrogenibacillus schlegelii]|uniref:Uncharacterized protein n=1 Tax=Hydrogenibacillus schlegelii TaxID=1484 RepID=A0A2T5G9V4_HYDSH|nr:MAG: hypothetical protein HSCHL_2449 [Hydrogenibacillus schlegelii]